MNIHDYPFRSRPPARPVYAAERLVLPALLLPALMLFVQPALAADELFGTDSPLLKFIDFIIGPFAYGVVIIALVVTVGVLAIGGEFSGFSRRMPIVVVAGAIVILAGTVITNLFGRDRAADLPGAGVPPDAAGCLRDTVLLWPVPAVIMLVLAATVIVAGRIRRRNGSGSAASPAAKTPAAPPACPEPQAGRSQPAPGPEVAT